MIADGEGWVYFYSSNTHPPELVGKIQSGAKSCIRGMCMNGGGSYLVTGATDGTLSIFELGRPKGERFTKQIAAFQGRPNVNFFINSSYLVPIDCLERFKQRDHYCKPRWKHHHLVSERRASNVRACGTSRFTHHLNALVRRPLTTDNLRKRQTHQGMGIPSHLVR
jgi:hypothetical protein